MSNFISENRKQLAERHYIRRARPSDFWFDFTCSKVRQYKSDYRQDFCLIIYSEGESDNAYIMPYGDVETFFSEKQIDPTRDRWTGEIKNNVMRLRPEKVTMSVSAYYNAFHNLNRQIEKVDKVLKDASILYNVDTEIHSSDLKKLIQEFDKQYQNAVPHTRIVISEQVARPGAISDYVKKLRSFTCQLCGEVGFQQRNGTKYIETHHITPLHQLLPNSYCSDNLLVVCPTCHTKLHYAKVTYHAVSDIVLEIVVNGQKFTVERNIISN